LVKGKRHSEPLDIEPTTAAYLLLLYRNSQVLYGFIRM